jgi:hypothetical protein
MIYRDTKITQEETDVFMKSIFNKKRVEYSVEINSHYTNITIYHPNFDEGNLYFYIAHREFCWRFGAGLHNIRKWDECLSISNNLEINKAKIKSIVNWWCKTHSLPHYYSNLLSFKKFDNNSINYNSLRSIFIKNASYYGLNIKEDNTRYASSSFTYTVDGVDFTIVSKPFYLHVGHIKINGVSVLDKFISKTHEDLFKKLIPLHLEREAKLREVL